MADIRIRPDLKTAGGEVNDILYRGRYAGMMTLVYREGDRICGAVQLEKDALTAKEKKRVFDFVHFYIRSLSGALNIAAGEVLVTYSKYDHILTAEQNIGGIGEFADTKRDRVRQASLRQQNQAKKSEDYELVIVGEHGNQVEYHIYDSRREWIAEALMSIYGTDVVGEVNWNADPDEEQIGLIADLLVSDFDEAQIDSFVIDMKFAGEIVETVELTHKDLLAPAADAADGCFSAVLVRDDEDSLTYEIYRSGGTRPFGTATVDISRRTVTGFVDLYHFAGSDDRESIAVALLGQVEKEIDCESFNVTFLHNNQPLDEVLFENEPAH
jgi:hypothetical protein